MRKPEAPENPDEPKKAYKGQSGNVLGMLEKLGRQFKPGGL